MFLCRTYVLLALGLCGFTEKFHLFLWMGLEVMGPTALHIRRKRVQFGKGRSPLGEGKSQRCIMSIATQEVPLGKGCDHIFSREVGAQEI